MKKVIFGFFLGVIALALFLYFGGAKYVKAFGSKTEEAGSRLEVYEKKMKESTKDAKTSVKETAEEAKETVEEKAKSAKEAVSNTYDKTKEKVKKYIE